MTSIWLSGDAEPPQAAKYDRKMDVPKYSTNGPAYLGVFTDDPAVIGAWLPRPTTPFVPAPAAAFPFKRPDAFADMEGEEVEYDSPPTDFAFDFGQPTLTQYGNSGLSLF
jgi:hypothetical protein